MKQSARMPGFGCHILLVCFKVRVNTCMEFIIPSRVSGRGYKIGPVCVCVSVCVCVCQLVSALTAEPFDLRT